jgi:hypothetical protein
MIHEMGHAVATMFSHGVLDGFRVFVKGNGVTNLKGITKQDDWWINPAGYVGVPIFAAILIWFGSLSFVAPYLLAILGISLFFFVIIHGRREPDDKDPKNYAITHSVGVLFSVTFLGIAWLAHPVWSTFVLNFMAVEGVLETFFSLKNLARQVRRNDKGIDPDLMAQLHKKVPLLRSPMFWVRAWTIISILILGGTFWFTWLRGSALFATG